jgi:thiol-disulfide isomerase/thioredoxin
MEFKKYQHLERIGTSATEGIENGMCYIFPKIDGTNSQLWYDNGLQAGSRNRQLDELNDNAGFYLWALRQEKFKLLFDEYPDLRLYGEWLVPHTLKTYQADAWRNFYVFDVTNNEECLKYEEYQQILEKFGIDYIPPICKIENPSYEKLVELLDKNIFLIEDGKGTGEGIVIKNYDFVNRFGNIVWAKIVKNEFKTKHAKVNSVTELKEKSLIEQKIVDKYLTKELIEKEKAKIEIENGWSSKFIPKLFNTVFYCLVSEESWNFVKEFKSPTIDFKRLSYLTNNKIKELIPNLF